MAVKSYTVTVGTEPTLLNAADTDDYAGREGQSVMVKSAAVTVYLGGSDVNTTDGWPHAPDDPSYAIALAQGEKLYGVVASGTQVVNCSAQGV